MLLTTLVVPGLSAQISELTPLVGWQTGGSVEVNQLSTPVKASPVAGLTVSFDRGPGTKLDVLFVHQQSRAERHDPFEDPSRVDVSVAYLHIGGRHLFQPGERIDPYAGGTIGITRLGVNGAHTINPSFALAAGADLRLSRSIALRFDGRLHVTWINANLQVDCDSTGACGGTGSGGSLSQFTATTGLVFSFH
jgi:hypothetical protein